MACTPEEEILVSDNTFELAFDQDTVIFDTLFSTVGSVTKRLKVYNPNDNAIQISSIGLAGESQSPYTLYLQGIEGKSFQNQQILGGDSLLMLVEVLIDPQDQDLPFLVKDSILFETNGNRQDVDLVSWGQDANFLGDSVIACNTTWTAARPYVLYQSILIDSLCQLNIEPGTQIYCDQNVSIFVKGSISAMGTALDTITFRNSRLDKAYQDAPGQWGGILFLEGSHGNALDHVRIRNAETGIRLGSPDPDQIPDLILSHSKIENMLSFGILAFNSDLSATNTLVNNCGTYAAAHFAGGNYSYEHCTFANFPFDFSDQQECFVISDNLELADGSSLINDLNLVLRNSIVWGDKDNEILTSSSGQSQIVLDISSSVLKTDQTSFDINGNLLNEEPKFKNAFLFDYQLDTLSPIRDKGTPSSILDDLLGIMRDNLPDPGAYERVE